MNNKFFGLTALLGLLFFWRSAHATEKRVASWYGAECAGKLMANGKPFDPCKYTCASWHYPLGTVLRVSTLRGGRPVNVTVVVTDRGPHRKYLKTRQLDLSRAAFLVLAPLDTGLIDVTIEIIK